jgi:hypothetical protein
MTTTTPDWVQPGTEVAVITHHSFSGSYIQYKDKIARVGKRDIVLDRTGNRFKVDYNGTIVESGTRYGSQLVAADGPEVLRIIREKDKRVAYEALKTATTDAKYGTDAELDDVQVALDAYRAAVKATQR